MTERDVFEGRLRAALLRHVADGPTDFDALGFARTVAAQDPRRHGFAPALSLRGLAIPRVAWTLLLLAGLLAALVAGMLIVGSQPLRKVPAVVPPVGPTATPLTSYTAVSTGTYAAVSVPWERRRPGRSTCLAIALADSCTGRTRPHPGVTFRPSRSP